MSMFYCEAHDRMEDSDEVGFVPTDTGAVCQQAQDDAVFAQEWEFGSLADRRELMGGPDGGDGPDD